MNAPEPYTVLIGGGPYGIGSRITGSIPRKLRPAESAKLRATLAAGRSIEVVCESRAAWQAMRDSLFAQIGIGA